MKQMNYDLEAVPSAVIQACNNPRIQTKGFFRVQRKKIVGKVMRA